MTRVYGKFPQSNPSQTYVGLTSSVRSRLQTSIDIALDNLHNEKGKCGLMHIAMYIVRDVIGIGIDLTAGPG